MLLIQPNRGRIKFLQGMKLCLLGAIMIFLKHPLAFSQKSFGGIPESFESGVKSAPKDFILPEFSTDSMQKIDSIERMKGRKTYRFAKAFEVNFNPLNSGEWMVTDRGIHIWRISIFSKGAYSIGILLKHYQPAPGGRIFIYNPEHNEILGAYTSENIAPGGYLTVYPLPSERAIIEYDLPAGTESKDGFTIGMVAHDYKNAFGSTASPSSGMILSGACNVDINCPDGANWQIEKRAVCKLRINLTELCTGVLVNNVRKDGRPYLLTANHCIPSVNTGYNTLAIFNYEKDTCGGNTISAVESISGMWLKATTNLIDFSLLELGERPPISYMPYYAGWSLDTLGILNATVIHHPEGDVKKISYCNTAPVTDNYGGGYEYMSHWRINRWTYGTTEEGSSGSPLFNQNHYIIGTLTGGYATCQDPDSDYFQKFSRAWADIPDSSQQLKYWLDPDNTGLRTLQGTNPYNYILKNCSINTNLLPSEVAVNPTIPGISGAYAGHNGLGIAIYAERFISTDTLKVTSLIFNVAALTAAGLNSSLNILIWKGKNQPDSLIYRQNILYKSLVNNFKNYITLDQILILKDTFFVGFEISYASTDKFALFIAPDRFVSTLNTSYAFRGGTWTSFSNIPEYANLSTSMDIGLQTCSVSTGIYSSLDFSDELLVYPNPTSRILTIKSAHMEDIQSILVYDLQGRNIYCLINKSSPDFIEIDLREAIPGVYVIHARSQHNVWTKKLLKF
jgi:lysyl endopeptidase